MPNFPKPKIIPTAGVLIFKDNKVLLVKHGTSSGQITNVYGLPAGRIKKGEAEITTARRELKEETGLIAAANDLIGYPDNNYVGKIKRKNGEVNIYPYKIFVCSDYIGKLKATTETTPEWVKIADVKKLNLLPNIEKIINDGLNFLTKLDKKTEAKIKKQALKLLKSGRTNWDQRHTLCAVKWVKELIKLEGGDKRTLIPAIYFHDTGYEKLPLGYSHNQVLAAKSDHARRGAENVKKFLPSLKYFTPKEISRIAYLVEHHDEHENINEPDRQLVFEADGFAQIDWYHCRPSYDKNSSVQFITTTFKHRMKYIKTKSGKKILKQLLPLTKKYLEDWKE